MKHLPPVVDIVVGRPYTFLFWMLMCSVVGRLFVRLPSYCYGMFNVVAVIRTDSIVPSATSLRLLLTSFFPNRLVEALIFPLQI